MVCVECPRVQSAGPSWFREAERITATSSAERLFFEAPGQRARALVQSAEWPDSGCSKTHRNSKLPRSKNLSRTRSARAVTPGHQATTMFTGIINNTGIIDSLDRFASGARLRLRATAETPLGRGESVAI